MAAVPTAAQDALTTLTHTMRGTPRVYPRSRKIHFADIHALIGAINGARACFGMAHLHYEDFDKRSPFAVELRDLLLKYGELVKD